MRNYWKTMDFALFSVPYVYVDHDSHPADGIFREKQVHVKRKREMMREDSPYRVIFCRVPKRDAERFEEALVKLKDKMLLLGYRDYAKVCEWMDGIFCKSLC